MKNLDQIRVSDISQALTTGASHSKPQPAREAWARKIELTHEDTKTRNWKLETKSRSVKRGPGYVLVFFLVSHNNIIITKLITLPHSQHTR